MRRPGRGGVQQDPEREECVIGRLAPDHIGERGPEESSADIEQRQQAGETRGDGGDRLSLRGIERGEGNIRAADQAAAENLLQHGRGDSDHADAGGHVQAQHRPDQPKLLGLMRVPQMHLFGHDHRLGRLRGPTVGRPSRRRQPIAEGAADHEDEIDRGHGEEGLPHADRIRGLETVHQQIGERRADHRAAAEAHDGHAGRHAAPVGKPFDQRRNRRDVADPQANAADDPQAQPHDPKLMLDHAEGGERHPAAPAEGGDDSRFARAGAFEPAAPGGGREAQCSTKNSV